jgi:hypothetical protein
MNDLLSYLSAQPPFLAAVGMVLIVPVVLASACALFLKSLRQVGEEWRLIRENGFYDAFGCGLYGFFTWPQFSLWQKRLKDRARPADALTLFAGGVVALGICIVLLTSLFYSGEGMSRPWAHSLLGLAYLFAVGAFARASMVGAVKHWYGIR